MRDVDYLYLEVNPAVRSDPEATFNGTDRLRTRLLIDC